MKPPSCTPKPPGTKNAALLIAWISDSITTASTSEIRTPRKYSAIQISSEVSRHCSGCQKNR